MELVKDAEKRAVELDAHAISVYEREEAAKFLATASGEGVPNVVLVVSQTPAGKGEVAFGEFMMVKTKANLDENPRIASIVITDKLEMAGFKAEVQGWTESGPYVEKINSIGFFRYNAYTGIRNVAVARIVERLPLAESVPFPKVGVEFLAMRTLARVGRGPGAGGVNIPEPVRAKFNGIMSVKVIAYIGEDGFPAVAPVFGVLVRAPGELLFKISSYNEGIRRLKPGARIAANALTMDLMTYQVKGRLERFEKRLGLEVGVVALEEAYSCMPPLVGDRIV